MWKSREAFEKSTFFKRLKLQGFPELEFLWDALQTGDLKSKRVLRLNPLRNAQLEDFSGESFEIGAETHFPGVYEFDLKANEGKGQHPFWGAGLAYVQDPVALEIVKDLEVKDGNWVLDLCAAPGGKSSRIAELLGDSGYLVSNDADLKRARILSNNLIRHGALRSSVFSKDGSKLCEAFPETFDRILLDAPCSGESMFFKRDERRRDIYESEVQDSVRLQNQLIQSAATSLKAGGRMVYSTCTYNLSENEEVVRKFLKQNSEFDLVEEKRKWPHKDNTAGGYWAILQKRGSSSTSPAKMLRHGDAERHGLLDRDGKINVYAQSMAPESFHLQNEADPFAPPLEMEDWILMTASEAKAYLSGEALQNPARKQGLHRMLYMEKWALGPSKAVEGRFNNLLPLETRTQFRKNG